MTESKIKNQPEPMPGMGAIESHDRRDLLEDEMRRIEEYKRLRQLRIEKVLEAIGTNALSRLTGLEDSDERGKQ